MAEEHRLDQAVITLDGAPLSAELYELMSLVRVEESVLLPDTFTLRFDDPHFELVDAGRFTAGTKVDIAFSGEGDAVTVTRGEVTSLAIEQDSGGRHELVVTGMDVTYRLARGTKTRSFQQMTDADIAAQIAGEYGFDTDIDPTGDVHEYVLQSSQSDFAFLRQRGDRIGFDLWIAEDKLFFKKRPAAAITPPKLEWGNNLRKFKVRLSSSERCDELTVRAWDLANKTAIVGQASTPDLGTTAPIATEFVDAARSAFGETSRFAGQFPVHTQAEADSLAQSLLFKASGDEVVARGEAAGDPMIAAGATVEIASMGTKLSGEYLVTSVEHIYGSGTPYITRFVCGGKDPIGLVDIVAGNNAGGSHTKRGWGSLVIGLVTNNDDPNGLGRVKVKFPTLTDSDESTWAKVVSAGAGPSRGFQCTPEVGDEVLLGFEHDDVRRPVLLGGLWNTSDKPPREAVSGGQVATRAWVSRNGHFVEMNDTPNEDSVKLALGDGSSSMSITRDIEIETKGRLLMKASSVEIKAAGEVKVTGGMIRLN